MEGEGRAETYQRRRGREIMGPCCGRTRSYVCQFRRGIQGVLPFCLVSFFSKFEIDGEDWVSRFFDREGEMRLLALVWEKRGDLKSKVEG